VYVDRWSSDLGELIRGDVLDVTRGLEDASYDLIFADPPFNIGKAYGASVDDERERESYLDWCRSWLDELVRLLAPGGSLFRLQPAPLECPSRSPP
jgi:site-specific DNA-methyltransferase (adenine-specific)